MQSFPQSYPGFNPCCNPRMRMDDPMVMPYGDDPMAMPYSDDPYRRGYDFRHHHMHRHVHHHVHHHFHHRGFPQMRPY